MAHSDAKARTIATKSPAIVICHKFEMNNWILVRMTNEKKMNWLNRWLGDFPSHPLHISAHSCKRSRNLFSLVNNLKKKKKCKENKKETDNETQNGWHEKKKVFLLILAFSKSQIDLHQCAADGFGERTRKCTAAVSCIQIQCASPANTTCGNCNWIHLPRLRYTSIYIYLYMPRVRVLKCAKYAWTTHSICYCSARVEYVRTNNIRVYAATSPVRIPSRMCVCVCYVLCLCNVSAAGHCHIYLCARVLSLSSSQ